MAEKEECSNCRFFLPYTPGADMPWVNTNGICRRYAPQGPALMASGGAWQIFPPMLSFHWCGDYRPANKVVDGTIAKAA